MPTPTTSYFELEPGHETDRPAPPGQERFARKVEQLGKDAGTTLRLIWPPDIRGFIWGGIHKLRALGARPELTRWAEHQVIRENGIEQLKFLRYRKPLTYSLAQAREDGCVVVNDHLVALPEMKMVEFCAQRWYVEEKIEPQTKLLDGSTEWDSHYQNRFEFDPETLELVDALGEWPKDGKWRPLHVIAHHFILCCEQAHKERRFCWGQGRNPVESDVEYIEKLVDRHNQETKRRGRWEAPTRADQLEFRRKLRDEMAETERKRAELYKEIFMNEMAPTIEDKFSTKVFIHRKDDPDVSTTQISD